MLGKFAFDSAQASRINRHNRRGEEATREGGYNIKDEINSQEEQSQTISKKNKKTGEGREILKCRSVDRWKVAEDKARETKSHLKSEKIWKATKVAGKFIRGYQDKLSGQNSSALTLFHTLSKTIHCAVINFYEAEQHTLRQTSDELVFSKTLIHNIGVG